MLEKIPGPLLLFRTNSNGQVGGAWEQGYPGSSYLPPGKEDRVVGGAWARRTGLGGPGKEDRASPPLLPVQALMLDLVN